MEFGLKTEIRLCRTTGYYFAVVFALSSERIDSVIDCLALFTATIRLRSDRFKSGSGGGGMPSHIMSQHAAVVRSVTGNNFLFSANRDTASEAGYDDSFIHAPTCVRLRCLVFVLQCFHRMG